MDLGLIAMAIFGALFVLIGIWLMVDPMRAVLWLKPQYRKEIQRANPAEISPGYRFLGAVFIFLPILVFVVLLFGRYR